MRKTYEVAKNQFGESHWPVMRVVVMHHVVTGWLCRRSMDHVRNRSGGRTGAGSKSSGPLPVGSVLIGDRNFGVFSVGWASLAGT